MLIQLARIFVVAIAVALVAALAVVVARPTAPTVITIVVPQAHAAAPTTVVQPAIVSGYWPSWGSCGAPWCWRD